MQLAFGGERRAVTFRGSPDMDRLMTENSPRREPSDDDWFRTLFDRHWSDVHRYAHRRVGAGAADDIAEETFLVAWRRRGRVPADPLPWLYRTAAFVIANQRRSDGRFDALAARSAREPQPGFHDPLEALTTRVELVAALDALSPSERESLLLVGWEGLKPSAAAQVVGCTVATFRMRLHRARRRLRALLEPDGAPAIRRVDPVQRDVS